MRIKLNQSEVEKQSVCPRAAVYDIPGRSADLEAESQVHAPTGRRGARPVGRPDQRRRLTPRDDVIPLSLVNVFVYDLKKQHHEGSIYNGDRDHKT